MSANKFKYWEINTTTVVKALNKTDAMAAASRKRTPNSQILTTVVSAERIPAVDAHALVSEFA
jgi:hypothetical protein